MKKTAVWTLAFALAVIGVSGCKSAAVSKADEILTWLPQGAMGVFVIDAHRAMTTEFVDKSIKENKEYAKYQEFIKETGIDPQRDIQAVGIALMSETGEDGKPTAKPAAAVAMTYKKDALIAKLKEKSTDLIEQTYNGVTIYGVKEKDEDKPMFGAFFDDTHILFGTETTIKALIDTAQKKAGNVTQSGVLGPLMKTANKTAMLWSAIAIPKELAAEAQKSPMTADLESITALQLYFDYKDKGLQLEIKGLGGDAAKNKKLADTLNGFKALGSMAGGEKPEIGELINAVEISAAPDNIKIYANLPEALLTKLSKTAQATVEEKLGAAKGEEKKEEIKK